MYKFLCSFWGVFPPYMCSLVSPSHPFPPFPFYPAALSPQVAPSATESCFARQHNVSDNNNQCFSGANGHLPSQLAAQRPGAIDNQPLVTTDPMKARMCVCVCVCLWAAQSQFNYMFRVCESTITSRLSHTNCWGYLQYIDVHIKKTFKTPDSFWSRLHLSLKQLPNFRIQWASLHCRLKL